ncbi:MAG: glycosyl hydrolase, partial [Alistipes sp.]|nr:glycosyl hydrolase [Alistipes sp.]
MNKLYYVGLLLLWCCSSGVESTEMNRLRAGFTTPPDSVKPGVYWYFMDGCLSKTEMTKDLESMKEVGIGSVLFLEVNLGFPRGDVDYFSEEWQDRFLHAVRECERLGIAMTLGVGPGWTGSGGPWVEAGESMRQLMGSDTVVVGTGSEQTLTLPVPAPHTPFFGEGVFTPELRQQWLDYYEDVAVLAIPADQSDETLALIDQKALYTRAPYSSAVGVLGQLPEPSAEQTPSSITAAEVKVLTEQLDSQGVLRWQVPEGRWRILRLGMRNNGAITRPAPYPGLGFECDKFDSVAFDHHFAASYGKLLPQIAPSDAKAGGLKALHMDSWEMGAQNWSDDFAAAFRQRRGYDPLPYLPAMLGIPIGSANQSERFLWDLRKTAEELVIEQHAAHIRDFAHRNHLRLSIEPYDMNPLSDIRLCESADVPMCEFWTPKQGFNTSFSSFEASSVAHVMGRPVVAAEAFTTDLGSNSFANYPHNLKNQGDWAFAAGINKFYYHTFVHKYFENEAARPGMTMSGYGVNWDRGQTWWHLSGDYHTYVARCSYMLQQGSTVADILYVTSEDAPFVFRPPFSALDHGDSKMPDRKSYNFDACSAEQLIAAATVQQGRVCFPSGASYQVVVLPLVKCMTPRLLSKIDALLAAGATLVGTPPQYSPSLSDFPACDEQVQKLSLKIWGETTMPATLTRRPVGEGALYWGGAGCVKDSVSIYPSYEMVTSILETLKVRPDFTAQPSLLRYTHRTTPTSEIYFLSNRTEEPLTSTCLFRTDYPEAEVWNPITGEMRQLSISSTAEGTSA